MLRSNKTVRLLAAWSLTLVACGVQLVFHSEFDHYPWFLSYLAILFAPLIGGVWGGIGATLLAALLVTQFLLPAAFTWSLGEPGAPYPTLVFIATGIAFSLLLHRQDRRMETALQAKEDRLRHTLAVTDEGLWEVNLRAGQVEVNDRWYTLLGCAPGEIEPRTAQWTKLLHPDDVPQVLQAMQELESGRSATYEVEYRVVTKSGAIRWLHDRAIVAERDGAGQPARLVGTVADITDRKLTELQLRDSEERFRMVVENSPNPLLIWDETGALSYISPAVTQELGFTQEAMYNDNALLSPLVAQAGSPGFTAELLQSLGARNSSNPRSWQNILRAMHYCMQHPGEKVRIEGTVHTRFGVRDLQGVLQGFRRSTGGCEVVGIAHDITELRQLQRMLEQANAELEQRVAERTAEVQDLYDNAPAGYHSVDADGCVIMINQTLLNWMGYSRDEVVGRLSSDFLSPASRDLYAPLILEFVRQGSIYDAEFELVRKDGTVFPIRVHAKAHYAADGSYQFARATVFDGTERKRVEETAHLAALEMQRALRLKDEFLATMSHELRTPLNGILTLCEALQLEVYGGLNDRQQHALLMLENSGRHLLELINDVLDLSKIAADKLELYIEPVVLDMVCQASLLFAREIAHKKNLKLTYENSQMDLVVRADVRRLKQMLVNLLSNAVKFTQPGGSIHLSVTQDRELRTVRLSVQDTGIGIKPADQTRLFQPFTQIDSSLVRQYEGTGLGLALVKNLAAQHGGSVSVASSGVPGEGSRFTIELPVTAGDANGAEAGAATQGKPQ